jgi:hypothetical protein
MHNEFTVIFHENTHNIIERFVFESLERMKQVIEGIFSAGNYQSVELYADVVSNMGKLISHEEHFYDGKQWK